MSASRLSEKLIRLRHEEQHEAAEIIADMNSQREKSRAMLLGALIIR